ncbi:transketolase-like TK C-terminal-containing protein [Streptomyces sp. NPDC002851]
MAHTLWHRFLCYDPADPHGLGRYRFVLSGGRGSALLYALLHLAQVKDPGGRTGPRRLCPARPGGGRPLGPAHRPWQRGPPRPGGPPQVGRRAEQSVTLGWERHVGPHGTVIGLDTFGTSGPMTAVLQRHGFTADAVVRAARDQVAGVLR